MNVPLAWTAVMPMRCAMILRRAILVLVGLGSLAMDSPALVCSEYNVIIILYMYEPMVWYQL